MNEIWMPIPGWECFYEASNLGLIRSLDRETGGPYGSTRITKGRVLAPSLVKGYWHVNLKDKKRIKNEYIHRLVLLAFRGEPAAGQEGCHYNGDRLDNRLENLRWDTLLANKADMIRHGTSTSGKRNPMAKLDEQTVSAIRRDRRERGWSYSTLARKYGISNSNAHAICTQKLWRQV